jgi:hypothetical protein
MHSATTLLTYATGIVLKNFGTVFPSKFNQAWPMFSTQVPLF